MNSTARMWPWSFDKCVAETDLVTDQRITACDSNPGSDLHEFQGRGAPRD